MHAISSYRGNRPTNTRKHTPSHRQDWLQYTAPQLACNVTRCDVCDIFLVHLLYWMTTLVFMTFYAFLYVYEVCFTLITVTAARWALQPAAAHVRWQYADLLLLSSSSSHWAPRASICMYRRRSRVDVVKPAPAEHRKDQSYFVRIESTAASTTTGRS